MLSGLLVQDGHLPEVGSSNKFWFPVQNFPALAKSIHILSNIFGMLVDNSLAVSIVQFHHFSGHPFQPPGWLRPRGTDVWIWPWPTDQCHRRPLPSSGPGRTSELPHASPSAPVRPNGCNSCSQREPSWPNSPPQLGKPQYVWEVVGCHQPLTGALDLNWRILLSHPTKHKPRWWLLRTAALASTATARWSQPWHDPSSINIAWKSGVKDCDRMKQQRPVNLRIDTW